MSKKIIVFVTLFSFLACSHTSKYQKQEQLTAYMDAAKSLIAEGQYRDALRELLEAQKIEDKSAELHYLFGTVYFLGFKRHDDAKQHLQTALTLKKDNFAEAQNLFGVVLLDENKPKEAIPHFERAKQDLLYATPYFADYNLGQCYAKLGQQAKAVDFFSKALAGEPKLCQAYEPYASSLHSLGRVKEAVLLQEQFRKWCAPIK